MIAKYLVSPKSKRKIHTAKFIFVVTLLAFNSAFSQKPINWDDWDVIPGRLLVKFKPETSAQIKETQKIARVSGLTLQPLEQEVETKMRQFAPTKSFVPLLPDTFIGIFDPANRDQVVAALENNSNVIYVEPDRRRIPSVSWGTDEPNDYDGDELWGMRRIGAPEAWRKQSATRAPIRVAVMEERYDDAHQDLTAQHSTVRNNSEPISDHATHVAGTMAATGNNNLDVVGVANVELVSLSWPTSSSTFAQQISWARNNGIQVINMSYKRCGDDGINNGDDCLKCIYPAPSPTEQDAISGALVDIVFVAAAGNDNCNTDAEGDVPTPVGYDGVIGVSAVRLIPAADKKPERLEFADTFSNFGSYVDMSAPGVGIRSTVSNNRTAVYQGTSMASPHVAGAAAAILAVKNDFDIPSIRILLEITADDSGAAGRDDQFGNGFVRVDRAVSGIADVYVQYRAIPIFLDHGTLVAPYRSLDLALNKITDGQTIGLKSNVYENVTFAAKTISKPCTIISVGGAATIK